MSLTTGPQKEQHQQPVEPEEQQQQKGDEGLQAEQREVLEDLACHVEQRHRQGHTPPHKEHQQEQDHLGEDVGEVEGRGGCERKRNRKNRLSTWREEAVQSREARGVGDSSGKKWRGGQ